MRTINRLQALTLIIIGLMLIPVWQDLQVHAYTFTVGHEQTKPHASRILITESKRLTQIAAINAACSAIRGCK